MLASQVLRSTAAISRTAAVSSKGASRVLLRASQRRLGEPWILTDAKRLFPAVIGFSTFMVTMFGWPFALRRFMLSGL